MTIVDLVSRISLKRNYGHLADISGMTDSEFMGRVDELRSIKSVAVRAVCAQRWAKITFPKDHYLMKQQEAWDEWGEVA